MSGEENLDVLLRNMKPMLDSIEYVFVTLSPECAVSDYVDYMMEFREEEGHTLILNKDTAESAGLDFESSWARITLTIHSSLEAVGFLAVITQKLASAGISTNVVSAYFHDHVFVPWNKAEDAMAILKTISSDS